MKCRLNKLLFGLVFIAVTALNMVGLIFGLPDLFHSLGFDLPLNLAVALAFVLPLTTVSLLALKLTSIKPGTTPGGSPPC